MKKTDKQYMENKKEKKMVCKKFISIAAFTSILKISLAAALFVFLSVIAAAGDTTIATGDLYTEKNNELFLSLKNTEVGGHDYRLVSAGSLGGIGNGKFAVYDATAGLTRLSIDTSGNVGIGTAGPIDLLYIKGAVNNGITLDAQTSQRAQITFSYAGTTNGKIAINGDGDLRLGGGSSADDDLVIEDSGNVGIGTTAPGRKVVVNVGSTQDGIDILGTGNAEFRLGNTGGASFSNVIYIPSDQTLRLGTSQSWDVLNIKNGNVGIGTTSPKSTLDVNGAIRFARLDNAPFTCDSTVVGSMYLDSDAGGDDVMCVCSYRSHSYAWRNPDGWVACD